ncbi:MAG: hypothetical protein M1814_004214 [Vezdaea aestivalis]|nr:MAG: hypothetical protein M1814_004214 [Vezdaea aestivalis]
MAETSRLLDTGDDNPPNTSCLHQPPGDQESLSKLHGSSIDLASLRTVVAQDDSTAATAQTSEKTPPVITETKSRKHSGRLIRSLAHWAPEIISLVISVIALGAIISVIKALEGKPVRNVFGALTLNGLIQILSTILKAALLMPVAEAIGEQKWLWFATGPKRLSDIGEFDLASRGPRGSLRFLFRLPHNKATCLGAVITLVSLGLDTFTQLVVQTQDCVIDTKGQAMLFRTNNYTMWDKNASTTSSLGLDSQMNFAIFQGLLDPPLNATANLPSQCISGNCTFVNDGVYSTLAICHSYKNISNLVDRTHATLQTLPNSIANLSYHENSFSSAEVNLTDAMYTENMPLFQFEAIADLPGRIGALRASVFPCIQSFSGVRISNSQIQQTLMATTPLARICKKGWNSSLPPYYSFAGNIPAFPGIDCSPIDSPLGNKTVPAHELSDGRHYIIPLEHLHDYSNYSDANIPGRASGPQKTLYYHPLCTWTFGLGATEAIETVLRQTFGSQKKPRLLAGMWGYYEGEYWIRLLSEATKKNQVDSYMRGLVWSMTAAVRRNGDPSNSPYLRGTVQTTETCVQFEWKFLLYNIALIIAAIFFLSFTLISAQNIDSQRSCWKSAALPLIWCGLEGITQAERPVDTKEDIGLQSRTLRVHLVRKLDRPEISNPRPAIHPSSEKEGSFPIPTKSKQRQQGSDVGQEFDEEMQTKGQIGRWVLEKTEKTKDSRDRRIRRWGGKLSNWLPI